MFPWYFFLSDLEGGSNFLADLKKKKKKNTSDYAQVLVVTWAKFNSVNTLLPLALTRGKGGISQKKRFCMTKGGGGSRHLWTVPFLNTFYPPTYLELF